jgi:ABC-type multidrug transport system permease subunit
VLDEGQDHGAAADRIGHQGGGLPEVAQQVPRHLLAPAHHPAVAGAALLVAVTYAIAEMLVTRLTSPEEYSGVIPAVAIVPFFFAGSLYPITSLPTWLADIAKVLPLTHALALFRYGLTAHGGQALHTIWGLSNPTQMAALSLGVLALYAVGAAFGAVRLFTKSGTS